jgi:hypothetical protein
MSKGRINDFYIQYEQLTIKFEKQEETLKETNKLIKSLNKTIETLNETIEKLKKINEEQSKEILRLKSNNNKDSSNSSKPSSTNGFKKVITNRREKSDKKKGAQKFHKPHSLNNKLEQFINSGNVEETIVEVNKNNKNKNKRYIEKIVIDLKITKTVTRYRYYPNKDGKYNIPKCHNQNIQYGNTTKAICIDLMNNLYNSTDGTTRFIEDITNGGMTISKGTLCLWSNDIANKLTPETQNIEFNLLNGYYLNHDEAQIKIDGDAYNILCACNKFYTRLWVHKNKSQEALKEINFLPKFKGIIVKDGTELYNPFGLFLSQCLSHIQRYLKGIYENNNHIFPKKMKEFLSKCNTIRNQMISKGITNFSNAEYQQLIDEYDFILNDWEKELRNDTNNHLLDDEINLWTRMKYDNKKMDAKIRGDRDEILYFLKDFNVPSTNNQAERDQRNAKIKQKTGKWRSIDGANNYAIIRSCINTYKKNGINVLDALISSFNNKTIIV